MGILESARRTALLAALLAPAWGCGSGPAPAPPAPPPPRPASQPASTPAAPPAAEACAPGLAAPVLERAKAATAFVQVRHVSYLDDKIEEEGSGSGFFVGADGRLATCWHVVSSVRRLGGSEAPLRPDRIQVILRSGRRDQKVLPARLVAADPDADLAVLKVEAADCAWLELGRAEGLPETSPVWVLGFPLGKVFSVLQRGPEMSVNGGAVSSLRHDDLGALRRLQFDAAVIRGNSGGPVIDPAGRVIGVANIAIGTSRVNFAVPVERLSRLLEQCPAGRAVGENCALTVESDPAGAEVFLDGSAAGRTPLEVKTAGGYRRVVLTAPGRRSWLRDACVYDGLKLSARLEPLRTVSLQPRPDGAATAAPGEPQERGAAVFSEDFARESAADSWKQDTGGDDRERTWYVEDGALHQFNDDGLLHAVFAERAEAVPADFSFRARVRIAGNAKDGRAGLIFRATDEGFALLRLHRASRKVQLAYHVNRPFGWIVLDEAAVPGEVRPDTWHQLEVQVAGSRALCLLEGKPLLEGTVPGPQSGKVGFYSVDSRASFDDAAVTALAGQPRPGRTTGVLNFWFSERFSDHCGRWQALREGAAAPPWPTVPAGCLQLDAAATGAVNALTGYEIGDVSLNCVVSCRSGAVGVVFRRQGGKFYLLEVEPAAPAARLVLVDGGKRRELARAQDTGALRRALGRTVRSRPALDEDESDSGSEMLRDMFSMSVTVRGGTIRGAVNGQALVSVEDRTLASGEVGLYADKARAVFHALDAVSAMPGQE